MSETDDFKKRLDAAREQANPGSTTEVKPRKSGAHKGIGAGFRIATEMVSAIGVSLVIGIALDYYFGTSPWALISLFMLGVATAFRNAIQTAQRLDAEAKAAKAADKTTPEGSETPAGWTDEEQEGPWRFDQK